MLTKIRIVSVNGFQRGHIVFERGQIGESWRSQRWDSFRMNSTNKLNVLPDVICEATNADNFVAAMDLVSSMEQYAFTHQLPVSEKAKVISVEKSGDFFHVTVLSNGLVKNYSCRQVIIASGVANKIKLPTFSKDISQDIKQLHTSEYRNANQLPAGAVLVVGGAQSGCQIAEDLLAAARVVYLSTSMVGRIPRWYRGKDIFDWLIDAKYYETKAEEVEDPAMLDLRNPQVSGTGTGKDSISLQSMAKKGATILGKMYDANDSNVFFEPNAAMHVKYADEVSQKMKQVIDEFIIANNLSAPRSHYDEADIPDVDAACASSITILNLPENNVSSIIWSTGFHVDFNYIKLPVFSQEGKLMHKGGIPAIPGFYLLGYPWLRTRKSPILFGIKDDAKFIVDSIYNYSRENSHLGGVAV